MPSSVMRALAGAFAAAGVAVICPGANAADYGAPMMPAAASAGGFDGFGYEHFGYTGRGYPLYGYGGYVGPYYRNGCFGSPIDCGPIHRHSAKYGARHMRYSRR